MDGKRDGRTGGRSVGLFSGALILGMAVLAVSPSARQSVDIHSEYVTFLSGHDTITAYLAYPERPQPAPAVIVIHENTGLSDFARQTTDQLAKEGFVAIAPDLLSRRGGTPVASDSARRLINSLSPDSVTADLDATRAYLKTLRAVRADAIGVIGFCWGGGQSFRYATNTPDLKAFVVCYGPSPRAEDLAWIRAKGLGVYAENDARINAGVPDAVAALRAAGKDYQYTVYPGVGHGFLRSREKPEVADSAWSAVIRFFRAQLK